MNRLISPGARTGCVSVPASKSQAHRLLICAALGSSPVCIQCDGLSRDIQATINCLRALGASISQPAEGTLCVSPLPRGERPPAEPLLLPCGESGSTLRFLLPVTAALGVPCVFLREGRLPERPLEPLMSQLCAHGMRFSEDGARLLCEGQLKPGEYSLPGNVSSQYISGLLMALPLLEGDSVLTISGTLESSAYVTLTEQALSAAQVRVTRAGSAFLVPGSQTFCLPSPLQVEGDYSNAAFFLCMGALSRQGVAVSGLDPASVQGDRAILNVLRAFGAQVEERERTVLVRRGRLRGCTVDASPIPDLIPTICALAAAAEGETRIVNGARLRLKESDRIASTARMLRSLGAQVTEQPDGLTIQGVPALSGGRVDAENDHRIAMSAAVCACAAQAPVEVLGAQCVEKSYPRFWDDLSHLKGETV